MLRQPLCGMDPFQKHRVLLINCLPLYSLQNAALIQDRCRLPMALQHEAAEVAPLGLVRRLLPGLPGSEHQPELPGR